MSESVIKRNNALSIFESLPATSDLNIVTSTPSIRVDRWDSQTSNNPKAAGITGAGDGAAITLSYSNYGTQYAFGRADNNHLCVRKYESGTWSSWREYASVEGPITLTGSNYSVKYFKIGRLVFVYGSVTKQENLNETTIANLPTAVDHASFLSSDTTTGIKYQTRLVGNQFSAYKPFGTSTDGVPTGVSLHFQFSYICS